MSSYLGKLERLKQDSLIVDSKDARSVVAGSGRLRRNYDAATDRDLLARMVVNFTANVPREMGRAVTGDVRPGGEAMPTTWRCGVRCFVLQRPRALRCLFLEEPVGGRDTPRPHGGAYRIGHRTAFYGRCGQGREARPCACRAGESRYADLLFTISRASEGLAQYPNANSTMRLTLR